MMTWVRRTAVLTVVAITLGAGRSDAACNRTMECCRPGSSQDGDVPDTKEGSFCTDKPFEQAYTMKIGQKIPMELQLVDYCTDKVRAPPH